MPNWCDNWLQVSGAKEEIGRFVGMGVKEGKWALSHYFPMPEELHGTSRPGVSNKELVAKYGAADWYDWNMRNYGCKWDCDTTDVKRKDTGTEVIIDFQSPWSPPVEFMHKVQAMFPQLDFRLAYMETGCWFAGVAETFRDADTGEVEILVQDTEPEYWDEDGLIESVDIDDDDAFNEYKRTHEVRLVNPYEPELYYGCEPDD